MIALTPSAVSGRVGPASNPVSSSGATPVSLGGAGSEHANLLRPEAGPTLNAAGQSPAAIGLSWTDATTGTFTNFTVLEASQMSGWGYSTLAVITSAGTTDYVVSGLSPGSDYDWQVAENYQTCFLLTCTPHSVLTNVLNLSQPAVAFLNDTAVTSTSATLRWTNNATYGSLVAFASYTLWDELNGGSATLLVTISNASTTTYQATLLSGASYSFFVKTADCTASCGGSNPVTSVTQSDFITIGTPQTLSVTVFALHTTIDLGQSDLFTCAPTGGASPFSYAWDFANGTFVSGSSSEGFTLSGTGALTVTCRITDAEPTTASSSVIVQVNPPLQVLVSQNRSAADVGQPVAFNCQAVNGTPPYAISWKFGDGSTSPLAAPSYSYAVAGDFAPTCLAADGAGALQAPSETLVISPTLEAAASASSLTAAPGTSLTFSANATNGSGVYTSYTWAFGGGITASGSRVGHSFSSAQDTPITLRVIDSNGAAALASVVVNVSLIVVKLNATVTSITSGQSVAFAATASGGAGAPYNFTWSFGDGTRGYGAATRHSYSATGSDRPTLTVTDRLGATNTTTLGPIAVTAAPSAYAWFTVPVALGIALAIAAVLAIALLAYRRRSAAAQLEKYSSPYVPPTDPKKTIWGTKLCAFCGASNLPIRSTCRSCGKPLPRSPGI